MKIKTRVFGEIELAEDKIIHFPEGIIGFPDLRDFSLLYDEEDGDDSTMKWLQSLDEPAFAIPVIEPYLVKPDYVFQVADETTECLGNAVVEHILTLVTLTVPEDLEAMSVNLKAPILVNSDERKACQLVVEEDYPIKYQVYDILMAAKEAGE
jgi:flagellar assembly factor FliW